MAILCFVMGIYVASKIDVTLVDLLDKFNECLFLILKSPGKFNRLLLGNIYRNPHSTLENDKQLYALFDHIDQNFKIPKLIVGDFNLSNIVWYCGGFARHLITCI